MILKELMERAGTTNQGYSIAYLKDAMREVNMMIEDNVVSSKADVIKDQRFYSFPTNFISLKNVMIYDDDETEYVKIARVLETESVDEDLT
jgi:chemotaxis methyl-accepting protein methylase|tara:strand:- start:381 stop:653 length:273 start_codon:yes stop_codon:yes gene_type:complete